MRSTFNVLFYIKRNEPKKDGRVVIMVRITINGVRSQFSSKLLVNPDCNIRSNWPPCGQFDRILQSEFISTSLNSNGMWFLKI